MKGFLELAKILKCVKLFKIYSTFKISDSYSKRVHCIAL